MPGIVVTDECKADDYKNCTVKRGGGAIILKSDLFTLYGKIDASGKPLMGES